MGCEVLLDLNSEPGHRAGKAFIDDNQRAAQASVLSVLKNPLEQPIRRGKDVMSKMDLVSKADLNLALDEGVQSRLDRANDCCIRPIRGRRLR